MDYAARVDMQQLDRFANHLKSLPSGPPLNFYSFPDKDGKQVAASDMYPPLGHPKAPDFFGFLCMHQYGFWHDDGQRYTAPLYGTMNGRKDVKGSDLLNMACMRAFNRRDTIFVPHNLASLSDKEYKEIIFADDNGTIPFHDIEERITMSREYGTHLDETYGDMTMLLIASNKEGIQGCFPWESDRRFAQARQPPLQYFLSASRNIPGYNTDRWQKKNLLLAMAMTNRPERFLSVEPDDKRWNPVVDYHLMRLALRTGLVLLDPEYRDDNIKRKFVTESVEEDIRMHVGAAFKALINRSGRTMAEIDNLFWSGRRYCPEDRPVKCEPCALNAVCAKDKELFQPVFRTTAY